MTLQERMVAVYLRQAKLPPEEKDKLRLFLGLLLTTFDEEEEWEEEVRVEAAPQRLSVQFEGEPRKVGENDNPSVSCADSSLVEREPLDQAEQRVADPLAGALIEALDLLGMATESQEAEKYFGIRSSVLQKLLKGENIRHDSRARILQRVQDAGIAVTAENALD